MAAWTARDIPDQSGRVAVVTGANSGLGFQTALALAQHGAEVILACRDEGRGLEALQQIQEQVVQARVEVGVLDLADLASVQRFAEWYGASHSGLDLLINNAGVMAIPYRRTADGFEMQFGTNHLGHFALTGHLLPQLTQRSGARVVTVSSVMHRLGWMTFSDLQRERRYQRWTAYGQAKLANLLFAFELQRRLDNARLDIKSVAAHPGYASTNLQMVAAQMDGQPLRARMSEITNRIFGQPAAQGALPSLYAATSPAVVPGGYYGPDGPGELRGYPREVRGKRLAYDLTTARRLWEVSEQLTGVYYTALDRVGETE